MPRHLADALLALGFGVVFAGVGLTLAGWLVLTMVDMERATEVMTWAAANLPVKPDLPPAEFAKGAEDLRLVLGFVGLILTVGGLNALGKARQYFRPLNQSEDGRAEISLDSPEQRAGRPVKGAVRLQRAPKPGEEFDVRLMCLREYTRELGDEKEKVTEKAYYEERKFRAEQGAGGLRVPFGFEIPASAPPSDDSADDGYQWRLHVVPADRWFPSTSVFEIRMLPALQKELRAMRAAESPALKADLDRIEKDLGGEPLPEYKREQLRRLSPEALAREKKAAAGSALLNKAFIILFVAVFVLGLIGYGLMYLLNQYVLR